jgi:hypothetical protein
MINAEYIEYLREFSQSELFEKAMAKKGDSVSVHRTAQDLAPTSSSMSYMTGIVEGTSHQGTRGMDYDLLRAMARIPVISSIIQTRCNQVAEFSAPQSDPYSVGFKIRVKDRRAEPTSEQRERINKITDWLLTCGYGNEFGYASTFDGFLRMLTRDSLMFDQACFEVVRNRVGHVIGMVPVDSSTIRRARPSDKEVKEGQRDWNSSAFVQVLHNKVVAEFNAEDLCFGVRRPRTWIYSQGYGYPELEELLKVLTYFLNAETYNAATFTNGIHVNSILAVKSKMSPQLFRAFKREFYSMLSGANQAKRTPILQLDPEANEEVNTVNLSASPEEMGYQQWMNYLIKMACALFQIDPAEIGFVYGAEGHSRSMNGESPESRITASRDKGLRPLLRSIEQWLNRWVISQLADDLELAFVGFDAQSEETKLKSDVQRVQYFMTINEIRAEYGLEPLERGGDMILNPSYIQGTPIFEASAAGGAPIEGADIGAPEAEEPGEPEEVEEPEEPIEEETVSLDEAFAEKAISFKNAEGFEEELLKAVDALRDVSLDELGLPEALSAVQEDDDE